MKEIYRKLSNVQNKLVVKKDIMNDFGGYKYRNAEQILEKVKPLLEEEGLLLTMTEEPMYIEGRFYISVTCFLVDMETDERIVATACAREQATVKGQIEAQITGATSSYAKKYALADLLAISNGEKDFDDNKYSEAISERQRLLTNEEAIALEEMLIKQNVNCKKLLEMIGKKTFNELTIADAEYIGQLAERGKKA